MRSTLANAPHFAPRQQKHSIKWLLKQTQIFPPTLTPADTDDHHPYDDDDDPKSSIHQTSIDSYILATAVVLDAALHGFEGVGKATSSRSVDVSTSSAGTAGMLGDLSLGTGSATVGDSGALDIGSESSALGSCGRIAISVGSGTKIGGAFNVTAGDSSGAAGGDVSIASGSSSTSRGGSLALASEDGNTSGGTVTIEGGDGGTHYALISTLGSVDGDRDAHCADTSFCEALPIESETDTGEGGIDAAQEQMGEETTILISPMRGVNGDRVAHYTGADFDEAAPIEIETDTDEEERIEVTDSTPNPTEQANESSSPTMKLAADGIGINHKTASSNHCFNEEEYVQVAKRDHRQVSREGHALPHQWT